MIRFDGVQQLVRGGDEKLARSVGEGDGRLLDFGAELGEGEDAVFEGTLRQHAPLDSGRRRQLTGGCYQ